MNSEWVPTFKPSFLIQLQALPAKETHQVLGKLTLLLEDPLPDGKMKKQLTHVNRDIYRLRSGDYRIIYTFSDPYICLLKLVRRDDDTYNDDMDAEFLGGFDPDFEDITDTVPARLDQFMNLQEPETKCLPLPQPVTDELLANLRVPEKYHSHLLTIKTDDDLMGCLTVPQEYIAQIMEYMYPKPLAQVLQQPDYLLDDLDDLLRYKEGELLGFLLRLSPEQERFVSWAIKATGPTQVKGGPGTGKSTVALYRVRSLIEKLRKMGQSEPCIFFTTYTNALVKSSEQLLKQLLGEDARCAEVQTADKKMSDILKRAGVPKKTPNDNDIIFKISQRAIKQTRFEGNVLQQQAQQQSLERLGVDYLLEEMNKVIVARQVESLQVYMHTRRPGRKVRLSAMQKRGIWQVYETFKRQLKGAGVETWEQARARAETLVEKDYEFQSYDAVVIDEAQDLEPSMLRLLIKLCKDPSRLFITADANQSIYGSGFNWSDVHESLKFQGRTSVLRANYRSTREIGEAAQSYLATGILDAEPVERLYMNNGPLPAIRSVQNGTGEMQLLVRFLRGAARDLRLGIGSCAVLCPTNETGKTIAAGLTKNGLAATFMEGRDLDLSQKGVKVLTLNSAKGLEFPIVALAGFSGSRYNYFSLAVFDVEQDEELARARRTIFVGMTRALAAINHRLLTGEATLAWSQVKEASLEQIRVLLADLDLVEHSDIIGIDSVPGDLAEVVLQAISHDVGATEQEIQQDRDLDGIATANGRPAGSPILQPLSPSAIRNELERLVLLDLLGPAGGPEEELEDASVRDRYLVGALSPREQQTTPEEMDELAIPDDGAGEDSASDEGALQIASLCPSSVGFSFCVDAAATKLSVTAAWGCYRREHSATIKTPKGAPKMVWKRQQMGEVTKRFPLKEGSIPPWSPEPLE